MIYSSKLSIIEKKGSWSQQHKLLWSLNVFQSLKMRVKINTKILESTTFQRIKWTGYIWLNTIQKIHYIENTKKKKVGKI